jgi:hypothetical protein
MTTTTIITPSREQLKAERARIRREFRHGFSEGDILVSEWGVEQTNVDFYQVVGVAGRHTIMLVQIAAAPAEVAQPSRFSMTAYVAPTPGAFEGTVIVKRVTPCTWNMEGNPEGFVRLSSFADAYKWDGQPVRSSSYA